MFDLAADIIYMKQAIALASIARTLGEVPVGAVMVNNQGVVVSSTHNLKEKTFDPMAHAELLAIENTCKAISNWRLTGHTLYVSLEPCTMCLAAMIQARIERVVFGAYDHKAGAISLGYNFHLDIRLNHSFSVTGGVLQIESGNILSQFFKERRTKS